ncbi:hypothetical protein [Spiroplasma ixodetis]|uniref:hypothetical protein n=1 Tax=Spiroplasma ixodetis TaxID=2141 RepID=UPI0025777D8C|nr:hypothetical protein [Spiroplasma ixodetis]WJG71385.1 hypothetical protein SIXOD_v1c28160 [Spiroplasma ixodetis Y32]
MSKVEKNQKVKRTKKIKNPNAPKQPINAYFFFLIEQRSEFKVKYPNLKPQELVRKIYEKWLQLDITEKEKYQALANADKERYLLDKVNKK